MLGLHYERKVIAWSYGNAVSNYHQTNFCSKDCSGYLQSNMKLSITNPLMGKPPVTGGCPRKAPVILKACPCYNLIKNLILYCHHHCFSKYYWVAKRPHPMDFPDIIYDIFTLLSCSGPRMRYWLHIRIEVGSCYQMERKVANVFWDAKHVRISVKIYKLTKFTKCLLNLHVCTCQKLYVFQWVRWAVWTGIKAITWKRLWTYSWHNTGLSWWHQYSDHRSNVSLAVTLHKITQLNINTRLVRMP